MKLNHSIRPEPVAATFKSRRAASTVRLQERSLKAAAADRGNESAFTMVEIALSLAIIGFALVAILGVLPFGLNVQKENREETIINQDATIWMNAIRNGAQGCDDLTNYVISIADYVQKYVATTQTPVGTGFVNTYTNDPATPFPLNNGLRIIGLLSKPQKEYIGGGNFYLSNYVVAYVRSISGSAIEKFPQANPVILGDAFTYKMIVQVFPYVPFDPDSTNFNAAGLSQQQRKDRQNRSKVVDTLQTNSHDVRLLFRWPVLPNGSVGKNRQTFRALVGGQMFSATDPLVPMQPLYFIQPPNYAKP